jgi:ribonuclease R
MERDGQVVRNRRDAYLLPAKADLIRGTRRGPSGRLRLRAPMTKRPDIFLGPNEMREVLHGDRVMVRIAGMDRRGRPEGKLVEVLERANTRIVGRVHQRARRDDRGAREPADLAQDILVAPGGQGKKPSPGQIVVVELVEQPTKLRPADRAHRRGARQLRRPRHGDRDRAAQARPALRVLGRGQGADAALPDVVRKKDWKGREDLTTLPLVTIDGETAGTSTTRCIASARARVSA